MQKKRRQSGSGVWVERDEPGTRRWDSSVRAASAGSLPEVLWGVTYNPVLNLVTVKVLNLSVRRGTKAESSNLLTSVAL